MVIIEILGFIFFISAALITLKDNSRKIFTENGLYRKKIHSYYNGTPLSEIKFRIKNLDDKNLVDQLRKCLFFRRLSNIFLLLTIILFFLYHFLNRH